jgi:hypothetical protein
MVTKNFIKPSPGNQINEKYVIMFLQKLIDSLSMDRYWLLFKGFEKKGPMIFKSAI